METKEIKPKTLIAVLSAEIKVQADEIAKQIVEKAKGNNVEYTALLEEFILGKSKNKALSFSSFAKTAFDEIKDFEKLLSFEIELSSVWKLNESTQQLECREDNFFCIKSELDEKEEIFNWNKNVNIYSLFDEFKVSLKKALEKKSTEIELPEE